MHPQVAFSQARRIPKTRWDCRMNGPFGDEVAEQVIVQVMEDVADNVVE